MNIATRLGLVVGLLLASCATASPLQLSEEERAWIAANPVVRMAADPNWKPVEYVEDGKYMGLAARYIAVIERKTGLHFELVPDSGWSALINKLLRREIDVLPATLRAFTRPQVAQNVDFTSSYFVGTTVIITDNSSASISDLSHLNGKVVAMKGGGAYQAKIQALYPHVRILPTESAEQSLLAVVEHRADAALDASQAMQPFLRRKYQGVLFVSGVIASLPMELAIGVRRDLPMLRLILDKVLGSLSVSETDEMIRHWREETDFGAPSFTVLVRYYGPQFALVGAGLLLICGFALHARQERRRAERSEREKTMFLAVMSHEIRSPMNAILASMELLLRAEIPQEPRRLIVLASHGAENLLRLLDDVLDVSKLEAGRLELDIGPVDIMELVHTVADLLQFQSREKGIALIAQVNAPIARRVMLDRLRTGQILHNLLSNAIKFTLKGAVTVSVQYAGGLQPGDKGNLKLQVSDTGIGMDAQTRLRLFEPFAQASAATAGKFGGTGLGLPICRELVELMNGSIEVQSELGKGTSICVQLPCTLHASVVDEEHKPLAALDRDAWPANDLQGISVLVVEDTPANQAVMQAQLEVLGCRSVVAADGAAALACLSATHFDIVLMDCDLPDISGYEVTRRWRAQELTQGLAPTPVLAVSASTDTGHTASCFESGMDGVLKKPIKLAKLRDALQVWSETALNQTAADASVHMDRAAMVRFLDADINSLGKAWQGGDPSLANHLAHRLVGASQVLGISELAAVARTLEAQFKQAGDSIGEFDSAHFEQLQRCLRNWAEREYSN